MSRADNVPKVGDIIQRVDDGVIYMVKEILPGNPYQSKPKIVARSINTGKRFHPGDRRIIIDDSVLL